MVAVIVNYLAVFAAAVASMVIGMLWYSPILLGKPWMKEMNIDPKKMDKSKTMKSYAGSFVAALVMAFVLTHFMQLTGSTQLMTGFQTAFWAWLGFVATTMITSVLFDNKSMKLFAINCGYQLVSLLAMAAVFVYLV